MVTLDNQCTNTEGSPFSQKWWLKIYVLISSPFGANCITYVAIAPIIIGIAEVVGSNPLLSISYYEETTALN